MSGWTPYALGVVGLLVFFWWAAGDIQRDVERSQARSTPTPAQMFYVPPVPAEMLASVKAENHQQLTALWRGCQVAKSKPRTITKDDACVGLNAFLILEARREAETQRFMQSIAENPQWSQPISCREAQRLYNEGGVSPQDQAMFYDFVVRYYCRDAR